jgi:hypothetical protein
VLCVLTYIKGSQAARVNNSLVIYFCLSLEKKLIKIGESESKVPEGSGG